MKQEEALKILQNFADGLLNEEEYEKMKSDSLKKRKKQKKVDFSSEKSMSVVNDDISIRKKKRLKQKRRKKEKKCEESCVEVTSGKVNELLKPSVKTDNKTLAKLQLDCGLIKGSNQLKSAVVSDENSIVSQDIDPKVTVYKNPSSKRKEIIDQEENLVVHSDNTNKSNNVFKLNKARHDVLKLGISGFSKEKKKKAEIALAVKLGAKPPKNESINYKVLLERRKQTANDSIDEIRFPKKKHKRVKKLKSLDGQLGKFRNGIQYIKKDDINRIKRQKHKK